MIFFALLQQVDTNTLDPGVTNPWNKKYHWPEKCQKFKVWTRKWPDFWIFRSEYKKWWLAALDIIIAHNSDFSNWRTCSPVLEGKSILEDKSYLSSFFGGQGKIPYKKIILQLIQKHKLHYIFFFSIFFHIFTSLVKPHFPFFLKSLSSIKTGTTGQPFFHSNWRTLPDSTHEGKLNACATLLCI